MGIESMPAEHDAHVYPQPYTASYPEGSYPQTFDSHLPEVVRDNGQYNTATDQHTDKSGVTEAHELGLSDNRESKTTPVNQGGHGFTSRRKVLLGFVIAIVLIAAIVGGAVGGVLSHRNRSNPPETQASISNSNPTSSSSGSASTSTGASTSTSTHIPAPTPMRAIASAEDKVNIFNIWQKKDGAVYMYNYWNEVQENTGPTKLNLTDAPIENTPLAVTTWKFSDYLEARVFYSAENQDKLIQVAIRCWANGTGCETDDVSPIDRSFSLPAGAGSSLITPSINVLREYMVDGDGLVNEMIYDDGWRAPQPISQDAKAHKASPVVADMVGEEIWLFWFDEQKQLRTSTSVWTSSTWSKVQNITSPVPEELPRALAIATSETPLAVQVFYFSGAALQQVQYSNNRWTSGELGSSVPNSSIENGPLSAVGWNNTAVRLYYLIDGAILEVESETVNGKWTVSTNEGLPY